MALAIQPRPSSLCHLLLRDNGLGLAAPVLVSASCRRLEFSRAQLGDAGHQACGHVPAGQQAPLQGGLRSAGGGLVPALESSHRATEGQLVTLHLV